MQKLAGIITESQYKEKMKEAIVDIVSDKLSDIFTEKGKMKPEVRNNIEKGLSIIKKQFPDLKILDHFVVGAAVTYQYQDESDIDTTITVDPSTTKEKFKEIDKWIEVNLDGKMKHNARPYQFKISYDGRNKTQNADAVYDSVKDTWVKQPNAEQAKQMYQSKIGDKTSKENQLYTQLEKLIQPSLLTLFTALNTLSEADKPNPTTDVAKGKTDITSLINSAYARYTNGIKSLRGKAYDGEIEKGYVSQNWGKGNVIYKMFDREGYNKAYSFMKDMIKNNTTTDPEQLKKLKTILEPVVKDELGYQP